MFRFVFERTVLCFWNQKTHLALGRFFLKLFFCFQKYRKQKLRIDNRKQNTYPSKTCIQFLKPKERQGTLNDCIFQEFVSKAITLPGEGEIMDMMEVADPDAVHAVQKFIKKQLASELKEEFIRTVYIFYGVILY